MPGSTHKVLMLLGNAAYATDPRPKREAKSLQQAGYHISVICPRGLNRPFHQVLDGVHVYHFPTLYHGGGVFGYLMEYGYTFIAMFVLSLWVWLRRGVDIVHVHNPPDILFFIAIFFKLFGKKFVFDHHDLSPELYLSQFSRKPISFLYSLLIVIERWSCRLADRVLATNTSYREIEMTRAGIPASKIFIVRNNPDQEMRLVAPDPELRRRTSPIIAYVGAMGRQDGVDYLLRALHHLVVGLNRSDFYCVLMGTGPAQKDLQDLTKVLGLEEHVWFVGWVGDRQKLLSSLSAADICVQPDPSSPLNDASTMVKTMEYMALGKPVVAFDLPETRHTGGDTILYAQPNDEKDFADQLARLMDDAELRHRLGEQGCQRIAARFTWDHAVVNLLQAYETLRVGR
jgi:glycosyltransferase involved in cell wall biosynthesis